MRKVLFIVLMVLCFGVVGCGGMKYNYLPEAKQADWPQLNEQATVYVGDTMLVQGVTLKHKALSLKLPISGACYDIPQGVYLMHGEDDKRYYFAGSGSSGMINKAALCDPFAGIVVPKNKPGRVCVMTVFGATACYNGQYEIIEIETEHDTNKQQSLLYSGMEGNHAKFTFVEKYGGKSNFSNSVTYDLKKSSTINYKGARIIVHSADNERVVYTVLKKFEILDPKTRDQLSKAYPHQ